MSILLPNGVPADSNDGVTPEEDTSVTVKVFQKLDEITVDEKELKASRREYTQQSGVLADERELRRAIQKTIIGWANFFALTYPRLKHTMDTALADLGYTITSIPPTVEKFNDSLRKAGESTDG